MSHLDIVGAEALNQAINTPNILTIVDFWAEWCGPCRMLGPVLEQVADKYADTVQVVKLNVDEPANQTLAMQYRISSIPRVIFFIGGTVVEDFVGVQPFDAVSQLVEDHLGALQTGTKSTTSTGEGKKHCEECDCEDGECDDDECCKDKKATSGSR